jgi:uncharacterized protein (TIGR03437 family)
LKKLYSVIHFLFVILIAASALNAQTVSVDKQSLSFSAQTGGNAQSQQLTINNAGSPNFAIFSNSPWLKINGQLSAAGQTPATVTITADPTAMFAGTYSGGLTVQGVSGPSVNVPVTLTISSIGVSPSPVTFVYQNNGQLPNPVVLNLTSAVNTNFTATATTATGGNWLAVPGNGAAPGTLAVSLNTAVVGPGMAPGTYNGTVTITPINGAPAVAIPVVLTVTVAPTVTANPTSINLNYQSNGASGTTNTPAQTLTLTNPGTTPLDFLISPASAPAGWLALSNTNGTIPANGSAQVTVSYLTSNNLIAGTYNGSLTIFMPNAANPQLTVPVRLLVANTPLINVPSANLPFTYQLGGAQPASKTVLVTSSAVAADATSGQMPMILSATTASGGNWLIVPPNGVTGTPFNVTVTPTGLAVGTYNGTITVTGIGATNGPQTIPVTLTVSNDPLIVASFGGCSSAFTTCPLNFPFQIGSNGAASQSQNIRVTSSTGVPATFAATVSMSPSAACGTSWLISGVTTAVSNNEANFPITVTPGSIASGTTCTGTVTITGVNSTTGAALPNSPVTIPVTLFVSNTAMFVANPVAMNFSVGVNGATSQTLNVTSTSSDLGFIASVQSGAPWLSVTTSPHVTSAGQLIVAVNAAGLTPGTYGSSVAITSTAPGVLDSPLVVPVTLTVTGATMSVTPNTLSFTQTLGGAAPAAKTVAVGTSGSDIAFNTSVNTAEGSGWLTVSPASGTATSATPATVTITANGSSLAPGTYHGTVTIASTSPFTSGSPASIAVTLEVKAGALAATPVSLSFAQVQNGPAPAAQKITVTGTPGALAFAVTTSTNNNSGNWITVSPASGNTPGDVTVTVNGASLAPGDYTGKVTITSTGATGSPIDIPVSLKVSTSASLTVSQGTLNLSYVIGTPAPQAQTVQVTASGPGVTFTTATTVSGGGNWLTVTPTSGTAPAALTITANPAGLTAGDYTGTIAINSPNSATQPATSITVKLTVLAVPKPVATTINNAASYALGAVSPGENIVIFGSGLGPATLTLGHLTNNVFDTTVANTRVLFDGVPAPIIYTRADQTSVMAPYFVARGPSTTMVIEYLGVQSNPITLSVTNAAPGIYTLNQAGSGQGAILNQDNSVNAAANPAAKGTAVAVYMTGEGTTTPNTIDGGVAGVNGSPLAKPVLPVTATVGGVTANVEYYGSAPSLIYGVMQVNIRIPANAPSGPNVPIVINVGNTPTQLNVTMAIQ